MKRLTIQEVFKLSIEANEEFKKLMRDRPKRSYGVEMQKLNLPKKRHNEAKRITIDGRTFDSLGDASSKLDISMTVIKSMYNEAEKSGRSELERDIRRFVTYKFSIPKEKEL